MKRLSLLLLALGVGQVWSATYYVATSGNDAADGSSGTPWLTVQKAASTALAGDTVNVAAGTYTEEVIFANSGSAGSPIVFTGARGPSGEWLTIIDSGTPLATGWEAAPEIGAGVYKQSTAFEVHEMTIAGKRVSYVRDIGTMTSYINSAYVGSGLTTGAQILALPSNQTFTSAFSGQTITFWSGLEALYAATTAPNVVYLRLRDGSDPNGLDIRISANLNGSETGDIYHSTLKAGDKSYLTIKNFRIRGGFAAVWVFGPATHHIVVEDNFISGGTVRVNVGDRAYSNVVRNNRISGEQYGYTDTGAWGSGISAKYQVRENHYLVSKFISGGTQVTDYGVQLLYCGAGNVVHANTIINCIGEGVLVGGNASYIPSQSTIASNIITGSAAHGIMAWPWATQTRIHDNLIYDNNVNIRFHDMNTVGESGRVMYFYRNRLWQPQGVGDHTYFHFFASGGAYHPEIWVYHNSFSGGTSGLNVSGYAQASGGIPNCRFLNNIYSDQVRWLDNVDLAFMSDAALVGEWDYNMLTPPLLTYPSSSPPAWAGAHNVTAGAAEWGAATLPSFTLGAASLAINSALDVTQSFVVDGVTFDPLPASTAVKIGATWDMGAVEAGYRPIKHRRSGGLGGFGM